MYSLPMRSTDAVEPCLLLGPEDDNAGNLSGGVLCVQDVGALRQTVMRNGPVVSVDDDAAWREPVRFVIQYHDRQRLVVTCFSPLRVNGKLAIDSRSRNGLRERSPKIC